MKLRGKTPNQLICSDLKYCQDFKDRMLGLLRGSNPHNLLFRTRFGVHTFFLKGPIDIVILNENKRIVKIKKGLKPNRLFFWSPLFDYVLELKAGTISKYKLRQGNLVVIE